MNWGDLVYLWIIHPLNKECIKIHSEYKEKKEWAISIYLVLSCIISCWEAYTDTYDIKCPQQAFI